MNLWQLLAPHVAQGTPVCLRGVTGGHHGVMDLLRIHRDGSGFVRFTDGVTVTIPALKERLT